MNRFICVHAHFYQPPRENPWLEEIELQDSAYPYHDWNKRIAAECYAPNTASRILDSERKIIDIVNNYSKISFNIGPTLLSWLEKYETETYNLILEADKKSQEIFAGHGSAIAQVYNHMIMPLANSRDKETQVLWGIEDFKRRFNRQPEGMWLAETAVDLETLEILSKQGIKFTILAPTQARRFRKIGEAEWQDASDGKIDPRRAYVCNLSGGRKISIFFYDGPTSQGIAFGGILDNGENFAKKLISLFSEEPEVPELVNIATDGETYGHHHHFGDMALTYCLYYLEFNQMAQVINYGQYLDKFSLEYEVEIYESSSWSCFHGVERWKSNCGCNSGMNNGWTQEWRAPLRAAMDWLRDNFTRIYEEHMFAMVKNPWEMRNEYIKVIFNRTENNIETFLDKYALKELNKTDRIKLMQILEMQRYAMLMYTSCGWFFDEISGIETVQIMCYAARAMQLARNVSGIALEETFITLLEHAPSNIPDFKSGADVYRKYVQPAVLDLLRVGVHYAVSSLFTEYTQDADIYSFSSYRHGYERLDFGRQKLAFGHLSLRSKVTGEEDNISFAVLYLGDLNVIGCARIYRGQEIFEQMKQETKNYFLKGDIPEVIRILDKNFSSHNFSLWHLFRDEQRKVISHLFKAANSEIESYYRKIYEHYCSLMFAVENFGLPLPKYFPSVAGFVFNTDICRILESADLQDGAFKDLVQKSKRWLTQLDLEALNMLASNKINSIMENLIKDGADKALMDKIIELLATLSDLDLRLNLWKAQNVYFLISKKLPELRQLYKDDFPQWLKKFKSLGEALDLRTDSYV